MSWQTRKPTETEPTRLGALSKLPIFLDLAGKRAILAGGTTAAAWKGELLAAAGAEVHIYAEQLSAEMKSLLARGAAAGRLFHHARPWSTDCFTNAAIALADAETDDEARAFYCAARYAGVPVNVIDKPKFCQFQLGSIVNRSPVVVAISTDGGAPILGQAIRRRIEALLPASLSEWGALAKDIRHAVSEKWRMGGQERRRFWDRFADRAFAGRPAPNEFDLLKNEIAAPEPFTKTGSITLVGAGPGDAELLTLKALRALQSADIILYDDLVTPDVLELARREAKRMRVGKRGGGASCEQTDINALMIALAKEGKAIVRLKSGDPMIFGRAGEEIAALEHAGIPVTVIPGITAASAMAASLNISLTHRDQAHSVRFVTGHSRTGEVPDDLDWGGLADPQTTLVFYMAGRTAGAIATRLMARGLRRDMPVVVVSGVSRADQVHRVGQLEQLRKITGDMDSHLPVLIAIGDVFGQRLASTRCSRSMRASALPAATPANAHSV